MQLTLRCEIRVPALAGKDLMLAAVPEQTRFSQTGARRDDRLIANGRRNSVQRSQIVWSERPNAPCIRFQIIDQQSGRQLNLFCQAGLFDDPGKVRSLDASISYRPGNSETGDVGPGGGAFEELGDNLTQFVVLTAGKDALGNQPQIAILRLKIGQSSVRAPNIAGQNHFSKFLQRLPSRSNNSSASFGPQVPDA